MAYQRGISRHDVLLFPEALEDYIKPENPVRFVDAYVWLESHLLSYGSGMGSIGEGK